MTSGAKMHLKIFSLGLLLMQCSALQIDSDDVAELLGDVEVAGSPIDDLLTKLLEAFRANMTSGFPQFGIPPLDPLEIGDIPINISASGAELVASISDGEVTDLSTFVIDTLHVSLLTLKATLDLSLPDTKLTANYSLDGLIGDLFPLYGGGACSVELDNVSLSVLADLKHNFTGLHDHLQIDTMDFGFHIDSLDIQIHNLFDSEDLATVFDEFADDVGPLLIDILINDTRRDLLPGIIDELNTLLWNVSLPLLESSEPYVERRPRQTLRTAVARPRLSGVSSSANADSLFDQIIPHLQKFIVSSNLDPLPLPEVDAEILGNTGVKLYNGFLDGLSSIHRGGESTMAYENDWMSIGSEVHFSELSGGYSLKIEIFGIGPHVSAEIKLKGTKAKFNVEISSKTLQIHLKQLKISDIGSVNVTIRGLGLWEFLIQPLIDLIISLFQGQIADAISSALYNTVESTLSKIDLLEILENL